MTIMNFVTPKAQAKHEYLFNKPTSETGLLNESSCFARYIGLSKLLIVCIYFLVSFFFDT